MLPTCICTTRSVGKRMLATFSGVKSFEFAKFINMRKYAANIRQHGMVAMADTGPREAYIKFIRRAWLLTNRQPGTVDQQVATKVHFLEALQSAIDSIKQATARPPKGSGAVSSVRQCQRWCAGGALAFACFRTTCVLRCMLAHPSNLDAV
eukprot:GHRQ01011117.1.p2 GENE.GHRQ01011117.1~~GHRQ01011117.1.p2  ORF type:complete len:151 (-),score=27.68 GHRQ01011117.1:669-1121(-)